MRVLHVIPSVAARYGGPSEAVVGLAAAQRQCGWDACIATTDADGPGRSLAVRRGEMVDWRGVPAVFFSRWPGEAVKYSPGLGAWLRANALVFDVLHLHAFFSYSVVAGARAAALAERPYFVRPLGTLSRYGMGRHGLRKRAFMAAFGSQVLAGAAGVHCTSEGERTEVEAFGVRNAFVAPLGVPAGRGEARREPLLLFVSRLDPKKNVEELIAAFHAVSASAPAWRLVIAGSGDDNYAARLRERAVNGAAAGRIEFVGWVDESTRDALLSRASLFALPSRDENFGIAVAEAMAAGVPVVVSDRVGVAGAVREGGAGWVCDASGELERALAAAMGDAPERERRGAAARRVAVERFGWDRCVRVLAEEYGRVGVRSAA